MALTLTVEVFRTRAPTIRASTTLTQPLRPPPEVTMNEQALSSQRVRGQESVAVFQAVDAGRAASGEGRRFANFGRRGR